MRNPFRSEAEAFRLVLLTAAVLVATAVAAAAGGTAAAVAVWAAGTVLVAAAYARRGRRGRPLASAPAHVGRHDERRLLVLALEGDPPGDLRADRVLVVGAGVPRALRRWLSDVDGTRAEAAAHAEAIARRLREANVDAAAAVGDEDPVLAVADALRVFGGDEIVVATRDDAVVERLRERFALPVTRAGA